MNTKEMTIRDRIERDIAGRDNQDGFIKRCLKAMVVGYLVGQVCFCPRRQWSTFTRALIVALGYFTIRRWFGVYKLWRRR